MVVSASGLSTVFSHQNEIEREIERETEFTLNLNFYQNKMDLLQDLKKLVVNIMELGEEYWQISIVLVVGIVGFVVYKLLF